MIYLIIDETDVIQKKLHIVKAATIEAACTMACVNTNRIKYVTLTEDTVNNFALYDRAIVTKLI